MDDTERLGPKVGSVASHISPVALPGHTWFVQGRPCFRPSGAPETIPDPQGGTSRRCVRTNSCSSSRLTQTSQTSSKRSTGSPSKWGLRRFAYEINHKTDGFYVVVELLAPTILEEVDRTLRLADNVVRHKFMRLPLKEAHRRGLAAATA